MNKAKVYAFIEFSLAWMGFCSTIISLSSYQWLVGGPCCRTGLFMQCQAINMQCVCNSLTRSFSWIQASAAFGILATITSGGAVCAVLVGDTLWKKQESYFKRWKNSKIISAALLGISGLFLLISGGVFASNKDQAVTSLAAMFPQSCSLSLGYGYGFVFIWISFVLVVGGCAMSIFSSKRNKVTSTVEVRVPEQEVEMKEVSSHSQGTPERLQDKSKEPLAPGNE